MFEQDAVDRILQQFGTAGEFHTRTRIWEDGAEFGYNKANEWHWAKRNKKHQVIDCLEGEGNKLYLLLLCSSDSKEFEFGKEVPVVCYWNKEWCRFERLEHTIGTRVVNKNNIYAWKEIVLPEIPEAIK